jgi:uncharacterized protein YdcH (DUF465 family)
MIESHDLFHEFPEHQDTIRKLMLSNDQFVALMKDYDDVDHKIARIEQRVDPASDLYAEEMKYLRVRLKDRLYKHAGPGQGLSFHARVIGPEPCLRADFIYTPAFSRMKNSPASRSALPYWRLSGFYFFYFAFVGAMAPFWGLYLRSLEFNAFQIGVLMSLLQVMRIFAPNIWGHIADHTGRRVAIVQLAALVCLVAFVGVFWATSFWRCSRS